MSSDVLMLWLYFLQVFLNGRASLDPLGGEKTGLTVLDIVKHAVNTVIHTLGPEDTFALVPFSTYANVALPFTVMDASGLAEAIAAVNSLVERFDIEPCSDFSAK